MLRRVRGKVSTHRIPFVLGLFGKYISYVSKCYFFIVDSRKKAMIKVDNWASKLEMRGEIEIKLAFGVCLEVTNYLPLRFTGLCDHLVRLNYSFSISPWIIQ